MSAQHRSEREWSYLRSLVVFLYWSFSFIVATVSSETGVPTYEYRDNPAAASAIALQDDRAFGVPVDELTGASRWAFLKGKKLFSTPWVAPGEGRSEGFAGLGPAFNASSCFACHVRGGRGSPPGHGKAVFSMRIELSTEGPTGLQPDALYGVQLHYNAVPGFPVEGQVIVSYLEVQGTYPDGRTFRLREPRYAVSNLAYGPLGENTVVSLRLAPQVIGLGLLEAIPEKDILAQEDPSDTNRDGISGRANWIWSESLQRRALGRFGWKATSATVLDQTAKALHGDMGVTNALLPTQNCAPRDVLCHKLQSSTRLEIELSDLHLLASYVRLLGVPKRKISDRDQIGRGETLFSQVGCAGCHVPNWITGTSVAEVQLSNRVIQPYTDLLLHDMGPGLADGPTSANDRTEWRTPPLWGIGFLEQVNGYMFLLHDGRARSIEEAILWHGGEATAARDAFASLTLSDRTALIAFVLAR
jgi:CxxC motif-containing protein (DUF1111 family)